MLEARDRLSRAVDVAELYRRRVSQIGGGRGRIIHIVRDELTVGTPLGAGGVGRGSAARVIGRENISPTGRPQVHSVLPSWYPRRPLQDITYIARAYQRRRQPGAQLQHNNPNPMITPFPTLRSRLCPPSVHKLPIKIKDQNAQDREFLTPPKKLLNSIDTVEKVFKEELQKPSAKKAQREKRKHIDATLGSDILFSSHGSST